jgi:imidazolonepropionase-like amidohydrolase
MLLSVAANGSLHAQAQSPIQAFVGARLIDGTGAPPVENSVILVRDGAIQAVGRQGSLEIPAGATQVDLTGRTVIPGLINAHGHVNATGQDPRAAVLRQLGLYARYGITTVQSLGGDGAPGVQVRDEQSATPGLDRARLFIAGPVVTPSTPEGAPQQLGQIAELTANWVKTRIDSGLGTATKMNPATYTALVAEAQRRGIPVAVHIVELDDAKGVLRAGADFIAHSVRDMPVDAELIAALRSPGKCYSPTLTRELSTFVYGTRPAFFDDPFFLREADAAAVRTLEEPARQQAMRGNASARYWEAQLPLARQNLKALSDAGVTIAMGTDTGAGMGRFQGYFEHLEMEMMADAGLSPMQILVAATGGAAQCIRQDQIGTITAGKRADLVVLRANPLDDIRNTRAIESVWVNGNRVPGAGE